MEPPELINNIKKLPFEKFEILLKGTSKLVWNISENPLKQITFEELGRGGEGVVYKVGTLNNNEFVAVKFYRKRDPENEFLLFEKINKLIDSNVTNNFIYFYGKIKLFNHYIGFN